MFLKFFQISKGGGIFRRYLIVRWYEFVYSIDVVLVYNKFQEIIDDDYFVKLVYVEIVMLSFYFCVIFLVKVEVWGREIFEVFEVIIF